MTSQHLSSRVFNGCMIRSDLMPVCEHGMLLLWLALFCLHFRPERKETLLSDSLSHGGFVSQI